MVAGVWRFPDENDHDGYDLQHTPATWRRCPRRPSLPRCADVACRPRTEPRRGSVLGQWIPQLGDSRAGRTAA